MFENFTEEYFIDQARALGQTLGVDTRQGSIYMDAATGHCLRASKFYDDLRTTFDMLFVDTCTGEVLDQKVGERNFTRKEAISSYYKVSFAGTKSTDLIGERFMTSGYYFILVGYDGGIYLKSEKSGLVTNSLLPGQNLIPVKNIMGLKSATLGELYLAGAEKESDTSLRKRYQELITKVSENGNRQQFKTWCESFEGVGRAIIYPLPYGANTVKGIIITPEGIAPTQALIDGIQEYIDPKSEGLGEGVAPIGCIFYAESVVETEVNISFVAELAKGYSLVTVKESAIANLAKHFKDIALNSVDENANSVIQYVKIVSILANTVGIMDFTELYLNGSSENILVGKDNVAVLGEVDIVVGI